MTVLALTNVARAESPVGDRRGQCPNAIDADREVDAIDDDARVRWLRSFLVSERTDARLWNWSFIGVGAGGLALNLTLGARSSYEPRVSRYFQAGASAGLLVTAGLNPLRVRLPEDDSSSCDSVQKHERALVTLAEDEAKRQSLLYHLVPLVASTISGAVLALAYDNQWGNAIVNTAMSLFVTELRILVAPNGARTALRRYRHGDIGGEGRSAAWMIAPAAVGADGSGLALSVVY